MEHSRRSVLGGVATAALAGLAGCAGLVDSEESGDGDNETTGEDDETAQADQQSGSDAGASSTEPADTISVEREAGGGDNDGGPGSETSLEIRDDGTELVLDALVSLPTPCHELESWDWSFTESTGRLTIDLTFVDTSGDDQACTTVVVPSQQRFRIDDPEKHVTEIHIAGIDETTVERSDADSS